MECWWFIASLSSKQLKTLKEKKKKKKSQRRIFMLGNVLGQKYNEIFIVHKKFGQIIVQSLLFYLISLFLDRLFYFRDNTR